MHQWRKSKDSSCVSQRFDFSYSSYTVKSPKFVNLSPDLNTPLLTMNGEVNAKNNLINEVTIEWTKEDCKVQYILSLSNSSSPDPVNYDVTNFTQKTLDLNVGIEYNVTVTAMLCGENQTSEPLQIFFKGISNSNRYSCLLC